MKFHTRHSLVIAAYALLAVAAFLIVVITQDNDPESFLETKEDSTSPDRPRSRYQGQPTQGSSDSHYVNRTTQSNRRRAEHDKPFELNASGYGVENLSASEKRQVDTIVSKIRRESLAELEELRKVCNLSKGQELQVMPLIVAHHPLAHPSLSVDGQLIQVPPSSSRLDEAIYPLLTDEQRAGLVDRAIARQAWWDEILGQLGSDLDEALIAAEEAAASPVADASTDEAVGATYELNEHAQSGGEVSAPTLNLFDLLGR